MKEALLSILRDRDTGIAEFRRASDLLAQILCAETLSKLVGGEVGIQTPMGAASGVPIPNDLMVVPIVRAALALVPAFTQTVPDAPVGFIGIERDEETAQARLYYKKFPKALPGRAIILDPMLATGGSACMAVELLVEDGCEPQAIYFTGVIAAQEGMDRLAGIIPRSNITVAAVDPELNAQKFIVPGLGDYGDRYYGT
jgi:uracil phosphoribosyltransferase